MPRNCRKLAVTPSREIYPSHDIARHTHSDIPLTALPFGPSGKQSSQVAEGGTDIEIESRGSSSDPESGPGGPWKIKRHDRDFLEAVPELPRPHSAGTDLLCCEKGCGKIVPLVVNGCYTGDGRTYIGFSIHDAPGCGIPVDNVLCGDLGCLDGRDDYVELGSRAKSMRLRIEVSKLFSHLSSHKLTCVESGPATNVPPQRSVEKGNTTHAVLA